MLVISLSRATITCNQDKQRELKHATVAGGQENVNDTISQKDVVKVAVGSKDHTTLVAALKQADLVTSLSNAGPFTVFAPTNAAFDALPKGTVDDLMKPEKKEDLQNILQYHVFIVCNESRKFPGWANTWDG